MNGDYTVAMDVVNIINEMESQTILQSTINKLIDKSSNFLPEDFKIINIIKPPEKIMTFISESQGNVEKSSIDGQIIEVSTATLVSPEQKYNTD